MSTSASIGLENEDGSVRGVRVNWDGYLTHVGRILKDNYNTPAKINKLMDGGGDIRSIEEDLEEVEYYDDGDTSCKSFASEDEFFSKNSEDFNYIFSKGKWLYTQYNRHEIKLV
jgi:hypothetical protein